MRLIVRVVMVIAELPSIDYNLVLRPGAVLSRDAELLRTLIVDAFAGATA